MKQIAASLVLISSLAACSGNDVDLNRNTGSGSNSAGTSVGNLFTGNVGDTSNIAGDDRDASSAGGVAGGITVGHRNGQSFVVWSEAGSGVDYHVYRHNAPITSSNLGSAMRVTDPWGPVDQHTSVNRYGTDDVPRNFVISDLGQPLSEDQGLFVFTTQDDLQGNAYYAVTTVVGGREDRTIVAGSNATTQPVFESVSTPRPVLTVSTNGGKGRIYTQYMDYSNWNPTLQGYAFNFSVALPSDYDPSRAYSLRIYLHAYGEKPKFVEQTEFNWPVIQLFPSDPGNTVGSLHSWWYGFARDHNYLTQGSFPSSGVVENFTEQRVLASVDFLVNDGQFNVDSDLIHLYGHSMGGSGALTYGMRYPSVFAGIYASEPMTNYSSSPQFQSDFTQLWGSQSANLPIVNNGRHNSAIQDYDSSGSQPTRVWNWMNHHEQLVRRRGDSFSYLMVDHGKDDTVIDWQTQGRPIVSAFTEARVGYSAGALEGVGHNWLAFNSVVKSVFGFGNGDDTAWRYPENLSFPGIHNASGSGALQPSGVGDDLYNTNIEWATPINNFHRGIVDSANTYEISLRSTSINQIADITPRNTNSFRPTPGTRCRWTANSISNNSRVGSGSSTVDNDQLLTIPSVSILAGSGTRLSINCL